MSVMQSRTRSQGRLTIIQAQPNLHFSPTEMQFGDLIHKNILLRSVRIEIRELPINNAVAVEFANQDWAKDAMEDAWQSLMSEFHKTAKVTMKTTLSH